MFKLESRPSGNWVLIVNHNDKKNILYFTKEEIKEIGEAIRREVE